VVAKPETTFIGSVHKHLPLSLYRVKNHNEYAAGIADCWYSGKRDLWIEYKFIEVPKRDTTLIDLVGGKNPPLSHLQQGWLRERSAEGRNVWVIVGCREGGVFFRKRTWETPVTAVDFRAEIQSRKDLAAEIAIFTGVSM
jgi:hypothetical protein